MKKMKFLSYLLLAAFALTFSSCDDDDDEKEAGLTTPVYGEDFTVTVNENDVTFSCTMEAATSVIWTIDSKEYTDNPATVNFPVKGDYSVVLSVSADGLTYLGAEAHTFTIEASDLTFLESGFWKNLTGGPDGGKTWRLDDNMSAGGNQYNKLFSTVLCYYQYFSDDAASCWSNGGHNLYSGDWTTNFNKYTDLTTGPELGTISFNGAEMTAKLVMESGVDMSGLSALATYTSETAVTIDVQEDVYGYKTELETLYGMTFSDEWATVSFTAPCRMPLDVGRVATGEYTTENDATLYHATIISCTDSALVVAIERVYEVGGTAVDDNANACSMLYNYVCDDYTYTYDDPDAFVVPDCPATSGTLEDGTYMLAEVPGYYYNWSTAALGDTWETLDAYKMNMAEWWSIGNPSNTVADDGSLSEWGQQVWDSAYVAYSTQSIVVSGSNVTVYYNSINPWYSTADSCATITRDTIETTFSASSGVITFADAISLYCPNAPISEQPELYLIPDLFSTGIGIGFDNIDESAQSYQTQMQNWIKQ